ncbi:methionine ABC transporter permease [Staphylococcus epidermidis]
MGKSYGEIFHEMVTMPNVQWPEVWQAILETLYMTVVSTLFAFVFWTYIRGYYSFLSAKSNSLAAKIFYTIVSFIVNLFRAIPFIILILLLIPFTSILLGTISGPTGALPALIIGAAPFYARLVEIAFKEIDKGVIEAAWSMGANTSIVVRKVLLPEAMPALVSGITVTAIALVGSTAIAGVIGAGGLGNLAYLTGFTRNQNDVILVSTVFILIIVFIIQFLGDWLTNKIDKR